MLSKTELLSFEEMKSRRHIDRTTLVNALAEIERLKGKLCEVLDDAIPLIEASMKLSHPDADPKTATKDWRTLRDTLEPKT